MPTEELEFELRQIKPGDRLTGLSLGDQAFQPLKTFIQRDAVAYQEQHFARTYGIFLPTGKIVAYITLICCEIELNPNGVVPPEVNFKHSKFPAVKIARLAVHSSYRKFKLGRHLVSFAVGIVTEVICPHVGCRIVVVDSKKPSVGFYERVGFTLIDTKENRDRAEPVMYVDLLKVPT